MKESAAVALARAAVCARIAALAVIAASAVAGTGEARAAPAAAASASAAPAPPPDLVLTIDAADITLGKAGPAHLTIRGAAAVDLMLFASRGKLGAPVAAGGDACMAAYTPPAEAYPQIEILAARDRATGAVGFLAFPLFAEDALRITTEPRATAELHIGPAVFGPVVADKKGEGRLPFRAGPGARAELFVTDAIGNRSVRAADLSIPHTPRLLVLPDGTALVAGADPPLCLHMMVVDAEGRPDAVAPVAVRVSGGAPVPAVAPAGAAPGRRVACVRGPMVVGSGTAHVVVAIAGGPAGGSWEEALPLLPGAAARIEVRVMPAVVVADGKAEARVELSVRDAAGNPIAGLAPSLSADRGAVDERALAVADKPGEYVARYVVPADAGEAARAEVRARVPVPSGEVTGVGEVRLAAGPAARLLRLSGDPPAGNEGVVRFVVVDAAGRRVPMGVPTATVTPGHVHALAEEEGLVYRAELDGLVPSRGDEETSLTIYDPASGFRAELRFQVRGRVRLEVGAEGSAAWWTGLGGGVGGGAWASLRLATGPLRVLRLGLGLHALRLAGGGTDGAYRVAARATVWRAELGLEALWVPSASRVGVFVAAAGGAALLDAAARVEDQPVVGDTRLVPTARFGVGGRIRLDPGALQLAIDVLVVWSGAGLAVHGPQPLPMLSLGYAWSPW